MEIEGGGGGEKDKLLVLTHNKTPNEKASLASENSLLRRLSGAIHY